MFHGFTLASSALALDPMSLMTFPGAIWIENDDPIMGGKSRGSWSVADSYGVFNGSTVNVPKLSAPGFCRAITISPFMKDASAYLSGGLMLTVRTTTPEYEGFKLAWGSLRTPRHHGGHEAQGSYKTKFQVPAGDDFQSVYLPFSSFSWDWSDLDGECSTLDPDGYQHKCCSDATPDVCPTTQHSSGINMFNIWAEGVAGDFHLEIQEIQAVDSAPAVVV